MRRILVIAIVATLLVAAMTSVRPTHIQATASAAGGIPTQLTSGAQVDAYLTKAHFQGYILLVRHGQTLLGKGYGPADAQTGAPNTARTKWPMFGVETFMVAIAVLKLQEEGKLTLQDTLCTYIEDCPHAWHGITIREMLDGTSPISNGFFDPFAVQVNIGQTISNCEAESLLSAPPGVSEDSLCNRVLLSRIIQRVTHTPFGTAMQQLIFKPAGMKSTSLVSGAPAGSAQGYTGGLADPPLNYAGYPLIYSTPGDIQRLDGALLAGKILSPKSVQALITPYRLDAPVPDLTVYNGYGCQVLKANQFFFPSVGKSLPVKTNSVVFDSGGPEWTGFMIDNFFSPDDGTVVVEMVNDSGLFNGDADNNFQERMVRLLWGA